MSNLKVVVSKVEKVFNINISRTVSGSGGGSDVNANNVENSPQKTQYIALGGKKKTLISALIALFKLDFDALYAVIGHTHTGVYQPVGDYATNSALTSKADLENGKIPASQLPSFVDDVVEAANYAALPATGESGKIYVTLDTNLTYRWTGSGYAEISASLALGETSSTAYRGDRGKEAYDARHTHSNKSILDSIQEALTTALKSGYDSAVSWIATNGSALINNSHSHANKTDVLDKLAWNSADSTVDIPLGSNVTLQVGQEELLRVYNNTGSPLIDGQAVYISGSSGTRVAVALASYDSEVTSADTIGIVTEPIAVNSEGFVTISGLVRGINTNSYNAGDSLWLGINGALTATRPVAPLHAVYIGKVVKKAGASDGIIYVKVQNGYELTELHDVDTSKTKSIPVDADSLFIRDSADSSIWKRITWSAFKTLFLQTVSRDNSLTGDGATTTLGMASMFDRARLVGIQYVEDFLCSTLNLNYKGFGLSTALAGGTYAITNSEFIATSSASANSGYGIYFFGTSGTSYTRPLGFFKRIEDICYIDTTITGKSLRIGHATGLTLATPTDGVYIDVDSANGKFVAKSVKLGVGTTTIAICSISANTYYRRVIDISDVASIKFYIYSSAGSLIGSATVTTNIQTASSMAVGDVLINTAGSASAVGKIRLFGVTIAPINL